MDFCGTMVKVGGIVMKRGILLFLFGVITQSTVAWGADQIGVVVDDTPILFDQPPVVIEERTMVPLRGVFESMGATVDWIPETQTIFAQRQSDVVSLQIGNGVLYRNGQEIPLEVPPQIVGERTMVPVRAVAEAFGSQVEWNNETRTVVIHTNKDVPIEKSMDLQPIHTKEGFIVNKQVYTIKKENDNGEVLANISYVYPELDNPSKDVAIKKLNELFLEKAKSDGEEFLQEYGEWAEEMYGEMDGNFIPFESTRNFDVTYSKNGVISIVETVLEETGGPYPKVSFDATNYDLETGKKLLVTDIFSDSSKEWEQVVRHGFLTLINAHPEQFFPDASKNLEENISKAGFYLTENGVVCYLNPDLIAPRSAGVVRFFIKMDWVRK